MGISDYRIRWGGIPAEQAIRSYPRRWAALRDALADLANGKNKDAESPWLQALCTDKKAAQSGQSSAKSWAKGRGCKIDAYVLPTSPPKSKPTDPWTLWLKMTNGKADSALVASKSKPV